jgi:hypothetical protein
MSPGRHLQDHSEDTEPDTDERPDIFPAQFLSAEDAADVAALAEAERAVARHGGTREELEGVAEAGKARRSEDRLEGWRKRAHADRSSDPRG